MILGRTSELKYLNTYYDRAGSQIMVVYGERNVGKTFLLRQFTKDKSCFYYRARSASEREQRYQWRCELEKEGRKLPKYPSFTDIFSMILSDQDEKVIMIVDEFQYIVKSGDTFMKELADFVNHMPQNTSVMFLLCSSSIGWVENSMVTRIGEAAYGLSGFLKVRELDFEMMMEFFPAFSMEQSIETFAILGGVPGFWKCFDDRLGVKENICRSILNQASFLYGEGQRIGKEELREMGVYNTILASIAAGHHKLNDLYQHTGFSRAKISVYLKNLIELELVEKIFSYDTEGKANAQKGIYRISNHFVHFYFTYLYPNLSSLEQLTPGEFYNKYIEPTFRKYVAEYYKKVCRQYVEKWNRWERLPIKAERIGEWVGKLGTIDIIAQSKSGETMISICNWDKPMMRYDDYEWLLFCAEKAGIRADYIYLFSVRSFDEQLNLEANVKHNLRLISMDEM
ncbi:MAG: ATP-binding protein [Lachnospiraceae bacterium]|nr:ATP-binding protein [Lachnospiraceae bacterium]